MSSIALAEEPRGGLAPVQRVLKKLKGRATVGDVVAETGLPTADAEGALKALLEVHRGHMEVGESGDLVYRFDPKLLRRDHLPFAERFRAAAWKVFVQGFKVWIAVMLVVYFVVFVALMIAALFASQQGNRGRRSLPRMGGGGHGHFHFPIWYFFWTPRWRLGSPYYGHRYAVKGGKGKAPDVPFYKKVFAFVFGPDVPRLTQEQKDRSVLRLIRARKGVLGAAELVQHTALPLPEAEEDMGRLMSAYGGEATVSPKGEVVYAFPDLMVSAHGKVAVREPNPSWRRMELAQPLTGNDKKTDAIVAGINGFNILAAVTAPFFIFPRLGLGGPLAEVGLIWIPVVFSSAFFAIPALRKVANDRQNRGRFRRNVRRSLLGFIYESALTTQDEVSVENVGDKVRTGLDDGVAFDPVIQGELESLASEFDADVTPGDERTRGFIFGSIRSAFEGAATVRARLRLNERKVGDIVYSSADSETEASERELVSFDKELSGYVAAPSSTGFEDVLDLIEFDEGLKRLNRPS